MVQTRTRSVSDTKALPTQGLGLFFSRSNSAASSGDHADLLEFSASLSNTVKPMAFLQVSRSEVRNRNVKSTALVWLDIQQLCRAGNGIEAIAQGEQRARAGRGRLYEWAPGGIAAAARRLGRQCVRAGGERACRPRRRHRRAAGSDRDAAPAGDRCD